MIPLRLLSMLPALTLSCLAQSAELPFIDLSGEKNRQVLVDQEKGQYLGHVTTCLLDDQKTILAVYPKGHGRGPVVYKRSSDGGKTWSERLPTPGNWASSKEVPTLHRMNGPDGKKRIIMFSGLYPVRRAVSEDEGKTWGPLEKVGDWGGIVVMGCHTELRSEAKPVPGHYMCLFHDDGRFIRQGAKAKGPRVMTLYQTTTVDGGLTWSDPKTIFASSDIHLCEPGIIRSPDGKQLAVLLRENARRKYSHVIFSNDEGQSWTTPRELPKTLSGDRHTAKYASDGRLLIVFRGYTSHKGSFDQKHPSAKWPTEGDCAAWVGTYDDIVNNRPGQYVVRLFDNQKGYDTTYPGVEILPDDTFVVTTYGHWDKGEAPYIMSTRLKLSELDAKASSAPKVKVP
ncbi:exo-alpha-sialidase [Verrucomicrobiaceae bacterium N1E253]|uniref:Exo-alpha-sialidase n=1 Tax=Oceaniferula marina TaxID=2748318 RepID=A0A851GEX6_9BACT|nr:sialidase family protein [Oceaniferula marina]NWK55976.1 exo-alpha-sialidase [Oceaniferula marina]